MTNTSMSGGYLAPITTQLPGGLSLLQYIQQIIVGITSLPATSVRPKWQSEPPKQLPNPNDDWCSFAVTSLNSDANASMEEVNNESRLLRHEDLQVICSFYGANAISNAGVLRDGLQYSQNRDALKAANMGFTGSSATTFVPEFINNRWFPRADITFEFKRRIERKYAVSTLLSADGTIKANKENTTINVPWNVI